MSIKSLNALAVLAVLAANAATPQHSLAGGTRVQMTAGNAHSAQAATMQLQAKRLKGATVPPRTGGKLANPGGGETGGHGTIRPQHGNRLAANLGTGPRWHQTTGFRAYVPMVHASCGADCYEHVLANQNGNKVMKGVISMTCPAGKQVEHLYYTVGTQVIVPPLVDSPSGNSVSFNVSIEPWTADFFEHTGQVQFGGQWSGNIDDSNNTSATAETTLHQSVKVIGTCTDTGGDSIEKSFQANSKTKFEDLDFNG